MLWTMIGILSGLCLQFFGFVSAVQARWQRARWMASLSIVWTLNCFFGAFVFNTASVEDYWYWKPALGTSAIIFTALLGAALYFQRRTADEESAANAGRVETIAIIAAIGMAPVGWVAMFMPVGWVAMFIR